MVIWLSFFIVPNSKFLAFTQLVQSYYMYMMIPYRAAKAMLDPTAKFKLYFQLYSMLYISLSLLQLAPAYEGLELGIGESLLIKAIAGATGRSVQQIKAEAVAKGDLGIVAEVSRERTGWVFFP